MKSHQESTAINLSGKVQDQYQISQFDFMNYNGRTLNTSNSQQLSFNDSVNGGRTYQSGIVRRNQLSGHHRGYQSGNYHREGRDSGVKPPTDQEKMKKSNDSVYWHRSNEPQAQNPRNGKKLIHNLNNEKLKAKQKPKMASYQKKELPKVRSYDLLSSNRPISQSILVESEIKERKPIRISNNEDNRFVIQSKNVTLDQLSTK